MQTRILLLLGCLVCLTATGVAQREPPANVGNNNVAGPSSQAAAAAALSSCAAHGPDIQSVSLLAEGTVTSADPRLTPVAVSIRSRGLSDVRIDRQDSDGASSFVVSRGAASGRHAGKPLRMPPVFAYFRPEHIPFATCILDPGRNGMDFQDLGTEEIRLRLTRHIRITRSRTGHNRTEDDIDQLLSRIDVFIDLETGQVVKTRSLIFDLATVTNSSVLELYYSDFRPVRGTLTLPYKIEAYVSGSLFETTTFSRITDAISLSDIDFELQ